MSKRNVIIAFGGVSPEHEVSVLTAMQVFSVLEDSLYELHPLYITKSGRWLTGSALKDLETYQDLSKIDDVAIPCTFAKDEIGTPVLYQTGKQGLFKKASSWPIYSVVCAFHGSDGENGAFQGVCEQFNIPYTGSGILASSVGMNKVKAKQLCEANDIPVTNSMDFREKDWVDHYDTIIKEASILGYPLIVKPCSLGSSIGVKRVEDEQELTEAVETAFRYDSHVLIEEAIAPLTEINCSVIGTAEECRPSVCERPLGNTETLTFEDKYQNDERASKGMASADRVIPADISEELTTAIQDLSIHIFKTFDASGVARIDYLLNQETGKIYFNEINTIPGSFSFYLWEKSEMSFKQLVHELIDQSLENHRRKNGRIQTYETNLLSEKAAKGIKGLKTRK